MTFYSKCTKTQTLASSRRYGVGTYASDHELAPCTHAFMEKHPRCSTGNPELAINTKLGIRMSYEEEDKCMSYEEEEDTSILVYVCTHRHTYIVRI